MKNKYAKNVLTFYEIVFFAIILTVLLRVR